MAAAMADNSTTTVRTNTPPVKKPERTRIRLDQIPRVARAPPIRQGVLRTLKPRENQGRRIASPASTNCALRDEPCANSALPKTSTPTGTPGNPML
jgi:hypothetical protein